MHSKTQPNYRPLAPRQAEALTHRARGLTQAETAAVMGCSVGNVSNLLAECFFKLHARSSVDAVAKAVQNGLIHFALMLAVIVGAGLDSHSNIRPRQPRPIQISRIRLREEIAA